MRRNILALVVFLLSFSSGVHGANRIDSLKTDNEVAEFVRSLRPHWKNFVIARPDTTFLDSAFVQFIITSGFLNRDTVDLDGNGQTDLLALGFLPGIGAVCVVVIDTGKGFDTYAFNGNRRGLESIVQFIHGSQPILIEYTSVDNYPSLSYIESRKLVYKFGGFLEYQPQPISRSIKSIRFDQTPAEQMNGISSITFSNDGYVQICSFSNYVDRDTICGSVDSVLFTEICLLLNYMRIDSMQSKYEYDLTDQPTYYLTIQYAIGESKSIEDYAPPATHGLGLAYFKLMRLFERIVRKECK